MAHQGPITIGRDGQPVGQVAPIARATRRLAARVDEWKLTNRRVRRFVDLAPRSLQRIALYRLRVRLPEAGGSRVVGEKDDVPRSGEEMVVPAHEELIAPHRMRAAVNQDEQRVLARSVELRGQRDEVVDAPAGAAR